MVRLSLSRVVGSFIDHSYIGLLGFVPLLLGLYKLYELVRDKWEARGDQRESTPATSNAGAAAIPLAPLAPASTTPAAKSDEDSALMHTAVVFHDAEADDEAAASDSPKPSAPSSPPPTLPAVAPPPPEAVVAGQNEQSAAVSVSSPATTPIASIEWMLICLSTVIDRNSLKVASVTMANGSDNRPLNDTQCMLLSAQRVFCAALTS